MTCRGDEGVIDGVSTRAAAWHAPRMWSVLRYGDTPASRVLFRSAPMSPESIERIVADAANGGTGTHLDVTFWDAPEPLAEAIAHRLTGLTRFGIDLHLFRGLADDARGISFAPRLEGAPFGGAEPPHATMGGTRDHASERPDGDASVVRAVCEGGA